ncbi:DUF397 domain-containing protein [Kitasatospora sp. NPDC058032]|uniref:DUF397 domain-containing protein n=1 Tax=unclassified Kitasatospora TaxID=2633591 RepID=UPI0036D93ECE
MPELRWQKSSFSGSNEGGSCVELAAGAGGLLQLRESDDPGIILVVDVEQFGSFLLAAKAGAFDHLT